MKKILILVAIIALISASPALACWGGGCNQTATDQGGGYTSYSDYNTGGTYTRGDAGGTSMTARNGSAEGKYAAAVGGTDTAQVRAKSGAIQGQNFAAQGGVAKVEGSARETAVAVGGFFCADTETFTYVEGGAGQHGYTGVGDPMTTGVRTSQGSNASYNAASRDDGKYFSHSHSSGDAVVAGGAVSAKREGYYNSTAGGLVVNAAKANANGDSRTAARASGDGTIDVGTHVANRHGSGGTFSTGTFSYSDQGRHSAAGAGVTGAAGTVTARPIKNGNRVSSTSGAFSAAAPAGNTPQ